MEGGTRGRPRAAKFPSVLLASTSLQAPIYRSLEMSTHCKFLLDCRISAFRFKGTRSPEVA